jgi:hypothetical protein
MGTKGARREAATVTGSCARGQAFAQHIAGSVLTGFVGNRSRPSQRGKTFRTVGAAFDTIALSAPFSPVTTGAAFSLASIHRSAWKGNSANFGFRGFSEVRCDFFCI